MRIAVLAALLLASTAFADDEPQEQGNLNMTEKGGAPEGGYKGVAPGAQALPPHPPKMPVKKGPQKMTWSGFQVKDGVPTVFLETTANPDYNVTAAPGELVIMLKNTVVPLRNNRRALDVTAFSTNVKKVTTEARGREVEVIITTRDSGRPAHHERVEDAAGGFRMLVIELPSAGTK